MARPRALSPLLVTTLSNVSAIAAGGYHSLAVKSDGTAWAWGYNAYGQLADSTTTQRTTPTQMTGVSGASAVAGGSNHSLLLKSDGTVYAAGVNSVGQLGDNTNTQRTSMTSTGLTGVTRIDAGATHSIALKSDGTVWAWGGNSWGCLGDGTTTMRKAPVQLSVTSIAMIAAGDYHTFAVTSAGVVWSWGYNVNGGLGDGTTDDRAAPDTISGANYAWKVGRPMFSIAPGQFSTPQTVVVSSASPNAEIRYTLTGDDPVDTDPLVPGAGVVLDRNMTLKAKAWVGTTPASSVAMGLYTFKVTTPTIAPATGTFTTPQTVTLSLTTPSSVIRYTTDGTTPVESSPTYARPFSVGTTTVVKAAGFRDGWTTSTMATATLTMNYGTLDPPTIAPAAGSYTNSVEVTLGSEVSSATIRYTLDGSTPTTASAAYVEAISVQAGLTLKAKAFAPDFTASDVSQATYTITLGAPAISPASGTYDATQLITITSPITGATVRYTLNGTDPTSSSPIVPAAGTLAIGNFIIKATAFRTGATTSPVATADFRVTGTAMAGLAAAGDAYSLAVRSDGVAWSWGYNGFGQLGNGTTTDSSAPAIVPSPTGIVSLSAGQRHVAVVVGNGDVYAWGGNNYGQVGDGTTGTKMFATRITGVTGASVAAGYDHTLVVATDGTVWSWGNNATGQLGDGTTQAHYSPTHLATLSNISKVAAGTALSVALNSSGTVFTWGRNSNGQLGDGGTTNRSTPAAVSGISIAVAIAAGDYHVVALLADGTLRAWGANSSGQLGDGTITQRTSPVSVSTLSSVTAIAAGTAYSLALKSDGTVWAWGANGYGQLGDGTTTGRRTPGQVPGLPAIAAIAAGNGQSIAIGADGSVWAWGRNSSGQVGDTTTVSPRKSPVQIANTGFVWKLPNVTFGLPSGRYFTTLAVPVVCGDGAAVIHYTTNGVDPTEGDPTIASGATVSVDVSLTLKAKSWKSGAPASEVTSASYELKVTTPTATPSSGRYDTTQNVMLSTTTPGTTIRYTVDGVEPTLTSPTFTTPITVDDSRTIKAIASRTGWTTSDAGAASFWILGDALVAPTFDPAAGSFDEPIVVTLSASAGSVIRYRTDGADPEEDAPLYNTPLLVTRTTRVTARAFRSGAAPSAVVDATFTFDAAGASAPPTIGSPGGRFVTRQRVTVTAAAGATIRYTTTGLDPSETDPEVPADGVIVVDRALILKARAWEPGLAASAVSRADFVVTGAVYGAGYTYLALTSDGTLWGWGANYYGNVGDGTSTDRTSPVQVMTNVRSAALSRYASFAIKEDGTLWAWGKAGLVGDGTMYTRLSPVQVTALTDVVAVSGTDDHTLAITIDGAVWAWGDNGNGQLGDGTTTRRDSPVRVIGLSGVKSIATGPQFSLAIEADGAAAGTVWAWGVNSKGQLGDGSTATRVVPVRVAALDAAVALAANFQSAFAVADDGSVHAWGSNYGGLLANQMFVDSFVPTRVAAVADVTAIAASSSWAIAADRSGRAWGLGTPGECMFGDSRWEFYTDVEPVPRRIAELESVADVAVGIWASLVLTADGTPWVAGSAQLDFPESHCGFRAVPNLTLAPNAWLLTDADDDGLPAWREYQIGTDPLDADTNDDGLADGVDLDTLTEPDSDHDGIPNVTERAHGTDPFLADTDGDGYDDAADAFPLDPAQHDPLTPTEGDTTPPVITLTEPTSAVPIP